MRSLAVNQANLDNQRNAVQEERRLRMDRPASRDREDECGERDRRFQAYRSTRRAAYHAGQGSDEAAAAYSSSSSTSERVR